MKTRGNDEEGSVRWGLVYLAIAFSAALMMVVLWMFSRAFS